MDYRDRITATPSIDPTAYVAPGAAVLGDVTIGPHSSVWFHCVLRGDANAIRVGARTNIQDLAVLHGERVSADHPVILGDDVTVGHSAIVHGCVVGDRCLIGMGAVVLTGCRIGEDSIIAAGAVVREGTVVPPRSLVIGVPAAVKRTLTDAEVARIRVTGAAYLDYSEVYRGLGEARVRALAFGPRG